jgi:hypothetical protein
MCGEEPTLEPQLGAPPFLFLHPPQKQANVAAAVVALMYAWSLTITYAPCRLQNTVCCTFQLNSN